MQCSKSLFEQLTGPDGWNLSPAAAIYCVVVVGLSDLLPVKCRFPILLALEVETGTVPENRLTPIR